jgi:uncharacterized protein YjbJ (UPF0337 family)
VFECLEGCSGPSVFFRFLNNLWQLESIMSGKTDVVKGRIKEAAGALIGNDELRDKGKADQAVGKVKQVAEKAVEAVEEAVKKVSK